VVTAQFTAPIIPYPAQGDIPTAETAAAALGLEAADIGFAGHRLGLFVGGPTFAFVPLASREALTRAKPAEPAWSRMTGAANTVGVYCYTPGGGDPETAYRARMFAPTGGIPEDPATGSASALLAAQLLASGELKEGTNTFRLEQGYEMGRPSDIGLEISLADGKIEAVMISGSSVTVSEGEIEVD
jgi:trans-2,3-dihydro-3-hydroxyanthranilate isomerase